MAWEQVSTLQSLHANAASLTLYHNLHAAGVFFIGYALFQIPSNLILVKIGAPTWLGSMLALWGTVAACCASISTAAQFMLLRFLLGVAECAAFPGGLKKLGTTLFMSGKGFSTFHCLR